MFAFEIVLEANIGIWSMNWRSCPNFEKKSYSKPLLPYSEIQEKYLHRIGIFFLNRRPFWVGILRSIAVRNSGFILLVYWVDYDLQKMSLYAA